METTTMDARQRLAEAVEDWAAAREATLDGALRHAVTTWRGWRERALAEAPTPFETVFPIRAGATLEAIVQAHIAKIEALAAERRAEYARARADLAVSHAKLEILGNEVVPREIDWEVSWFRMALQPEQPEQSRDEAVAAARFLACDLGVDGCARVAEGELHPFLSERTGERAPKEFYRDLACFMLAAGETGREMIHGVLASGSAAIAPVMHLATLVDEVQKGDKTE